MRRASPIALCVFLSGALLSGALSGCASRVGDLRGNIGLVSTLPQPSRPPEPSRPQGMPEIALLWTRTVDPSAGRVAYAMAPVPQPRPVEPERTEAPPDEPAKPPAEDTPPNPPSQIALPRDVLPPFPSLASDASPHQRDFQDAAIRAVKRIYENDSDDPSIVLSLRERLETSPPLAAMKGGWIPVLTAAAERAQTLQKVAPVLRLLRQAYTPSRRDPKGFFRDIDQPACRQAFALLFEVALEAVDLQVNVPNVGRMTLREADALCRDSHELILAERLFPKTQGPPPLRKLVRRLYQDTYPGSLVKKITMSEGWRESSDAQRRSLRAVVGVKRENAFPEDPCVMEEISIHQTRSGKRFEATECCDVHSSVAIACEELE